ncbi:MAG: hypothetical protein Q9219_003845 [cf. Caloplaca sp. 3 TL-2023]
MAPSSSIVSKLKVQLKLSISRLRMVQQKDTAIAKQQRRQMAHLLELGKEESARIRVENIIRSDITTELLEILELYCELLLARIGLLEAKECDPGLEEPIKSIIYAAPRTDVKELQQARQLLVEKYGKEFALVAVENSDGKVAERVLKKLKVEPPDPELVTLYLREIAKTYGVDWPRGERKTEQENDEDDDEPSGGVADKNLEAPLTTEELNKATPPRDLGPKSPVSIAPPSPSTDNLSPKVRLPGPPELKPGAKMSGLKKQTPTTQAQSDPKGKNDEDGTQTVGGKIPDVDELARRFAALKRSLTTEAAVQLRFDSIPQPTIRYISLKSKLKAENALLVALLAASGPPNWKDVKLPAGRSRMACQHIYFNAVKEAQSVAVGDNKNAGAVKKRGPNKRTTSPNSKGTPKRKRGKNAENMSDHESVVSEDDERNGKKVKADVEEADQPIKHEIEEV